MSLEVLFGVESKQERNTALHNPSLRLRGKNAGLEATVGDLLQPLAPELLWIPRVGFCRQR